MKINGVEILKGENIGFYCEKIKKAKKTKDLYFDIFVNSCIQEIKQCGFAFIFSTQHFDGIKKKKDNVCVEWFGSCGIVREVMQ